MQKPYKVIENKDKLKINNYAEGKLNGKKEYKRIFQEMDGLWLCMQGKDRPKSGKSKKKK